MVEPKINPIFALSINQLKQIKMNNLVYSTAIGTNTRNAFNAWTDHLKARVEAQEKAKRWKKKFVLTDADRIKGNALFIAFTIACEREDKNYKNVAETLRNGG